jgi:hypothetical protein
MKFGQNFSPEKLLFKLSVTVIIREKIPAENGFAQRLLVDNHFWQNDQNSRFFGLGFCVTNRSLFHFALCRRANCLFLFCSGINNTQTVFWPKFTDKAFVLW